MKQSEQRRLLASIQCGPFLFAQQSVKCDTKVKLEQVNCMYCVLDSEPADIRLIHSANLLFLKSSDADVSTHERKFDRISLYFFVSRSLSLSMCVKPIEKNETKEKTWA